MRLCAQAIQALEGFSNVAFSEKSRATCELKYVESSER